MGCLRSTGREHVLERFNFQSEDSTSTVSDAAVDGRYAALVEHDQDPHYGGARYLVQVFDLDTGLIDHQLGGEQIGCPDYEGGCPSSLEDVVINANGFTAAHTTTADYSITQAEQTEAILAGDSSGIHVLDTLTSQHPISQQGPVLLTGLRLSSDTLTWDHAGTPESADLH